MGVSSSQLQPQELITFKKLPTNVPLDNIEIPERAENRRPTNVKWLIILGVVILIFLPFMIYTLYYSDTDRISKGFDKCGNICGKNNYHWDNIACSGKNWTLYPYLQYDDADFYPSNLDNDIKYEPIFRERHCVQSCKKGYDDILGRCVKTRENNYEFETLSGNDVKKVRYDKADVDWDLYFDSVKWQIVISCLISVLIAMGMLFMFRYAVAFIVWGILIGCYLGLIIVVAAFWYFYLTAPEFETPKNNTKSMFLVFAVVFTIVAIVLGIVLIWCRRKIKLVILLLKEATKAVFDMPGLIILPVISVVAIGILTILFLVTIGAMLSSGTLQLLRQDFYHYAANPVMIFTMVYNFVIYLWLTQFFTGIQYMVIAGAVSKWYFSRDKSFLGSPILTSTSIAFRYHLGTVALGGLIITIVQVIKAIILGLINNDKIRAFVQHLVEAIETFFKFLSKNAYIITAMHGQAFIRSGKRAAKLIIQNIKDIIAVNYIGDFVLGMAKFLIVVVSVLISMAIFAIAPGNVLESNLSAYIFIAIVAALVACVTFGVFETTIDTLFICYCEDNLLNDGMARPYFMSRNLMEFVQNSKEVYGKK